MPVSSLAEPGDSPTVPLDVSLLRAWPMPIRHGGDKFARGTAIVVGGSPRTPGAVRLAGEAALRMGAGRLQLASASEVAVALGVAVPEALVVPLEADDDGGLRWTDSTELATLLNDAQAVLIGPGMLNETCTETVAGVLRCISDEALVVLDARALYSLAEIADELVPRGRLVLTPNRQELRTLAGREDEPDSEIDDARLASCIAEKYGAVISCFGRVTAPDRSGRWAPPRPDSEPRVRATCWRGWSLERRPGAATPHRRRAGAPWSTANRQRASRRRLGELSFLARELVAESAVVLGAIEA